MHFLHNVSVLDCLSNMATTLALTVLASCMESLVIHEVPTLTLCWSFNASNKWALIGRLPSWAAPLCQCCTVQKCHMVVVCCCCKVLNERLVFSCGDNRNLGAGSKRLRAQTVTPCCLSPLPLLFPPLCSAFSSSSSPLCSFWRAEEMTRIHVPLHSILHLRLTAHGCQMSELKTNVDAVDDHELLWAALQCCSACFFFFFLLL